MSRPSRFSTSPLSPRSLESRPTRFNKFSRLSSELSKVSRRFIFSRFSKRSIVSRYLDCLCFGDPLNSVDSLKVFLESQVLLASLKSPFFLRSLESRPAKFYIFVRFPSLLQNLGSFTTLDNLISPDSLSCLQFLEILDSHALETR